MKIPPKGSDAMLEMFKASRIGYTDTYGEDPEILSLINEIGDALGVPSDELFLRSFNPPEFINIELLHDVLKAFLVKESVDTVNILCKNLRQIYINRKSKGESFEVRITVKSVCGNNLTEVVTSLSELSGDNLKNFLESGVEKANILADKMRSTGGNLITVTVECTGSKTSIKHVVEGGTGHLDFRPFLEALDSA